LSVDWLALAAGIALSAVSALLCIHLFLSFIEKMGFTPFVVYRVLLGAVLLVIFV
jgi:undecaprenyl-diphosphatase